MKLRSVRQFSFELSVALLLALVFLARPDWAVAFIVGCAVRPSVDRAWRRIVG